MGKFKPGMWVMKDRDSKYWRDNYRTELPEVVQVENVKPIGGAHYFSIVQFRGYSLDPRYWKPAKEHYIKLFKQLYESTTKTDATGRIDS